MIEHSHRLQGALVKETTIHWNRHMPVADADAIVAALEDGDLDNGKFCTYDDQHMTVAEAEEEYLHSGRYVLVDDERWRPRVHRVVEIARGMLEKQAGATNAANAVIKANGQLQDECRRLQAEVESLKRDLREAQVRALSLPEPGAVRYPCSGCGTVQLVDGTEVTVTCPKCGAVGRGPGAFARRKV